MSLKIRKKYIKKLANKCKFKPRFINDLMFEVKLPVPFLIGSGSLLYPDAIGFNITLSNP